MERGDVVVAFDVGHTADAGEPAPSYFVPRDPVVDEPGDIIRR